MIGLENMDVKLKLVIIIAISFVLLIPVNAFSISVSEIERKMLDAKSDEDIEKVMVEIVKSEEYREACQLLFNEIKSLSPLKTQDDANKALPTLRDYETLQCRWTQNIWGDAPKQYTPSQCDELVIKFDEWNEKYYEIGKQALTIQNEQGNDASEEYLQTSEKWYAQDMKREASNEFHQFCLPRDNECKITKLSQNTLDENFNYQRYNPNNSLTFEYELFLQDNQKLGDRATFLCGFANNITHYYETQEKYFDIPIPTVIESSKIPCGTGTVENAFGQCVPDYPDTTPSSKGGGCLIATATYGSELSPQVQQLRELRDNQLLNTESGTYFMNSFNDVYYSFSPIIADYERENPVFKEMVKLAITPMITSLSILNYVEMDSESKVLEYGISLILLNLGMYLGVPAIVVIGIRKRF